MLRSALVLLTVAAVLVGCSAEPETPVVAAPMAATAPDDAAHGGGAAPTTFGTTSTDGNGLAVTVDAPTVVTQPAGATPVQPWPAYVTVVVTLVNGTPDAYDPQSLFVSVTSGEDTAEQVFDTAAGLPGTPAGTLAPGAAVTFPLAFGVTDPAALTLEIAPDFDQPTVVYRG